jgi:hypothetical protein
MADEHKNDFAVDDEDGSASLGDDGVLCLNTLFCDECECEPPLAFACEECDMTYCQVPALVLLTRRISTTITITPEPSLLSLPPPPLPTQRPPPLPTLPPLQACDEQFHQDQHMAGHRRQPQFTDPDAIERMAALRTELEVATQEENEINRQVRVPSRAALPIAETHNALSTQIYTTLFR